MVQPKLWHEDYFDALRTDILASGGFKVVGSQMWPEKSPDKAGENLASCLNRTRSEKLDGEQIMFIKKLAKKSGSFATVMFEMDDIGLTHPTAIEPEDEKVRLQREVLKVGSMFKDLVVRLEKLV
jgi:hypothetical protein